MNQKTPTSGNKIVKDIQNLKINAFEEIFRRYYPLLLLFVERHVGDRDLAKDIVQDVFFKLYEKRNSISDDFNLKAWLYRVARNAAIDYIRYLKIKDDNKILMAESMLYAGDVDEEIDEEICHKINDAIDSLPEQCRIIIKMNVIENKKYSEIAEILGISVNTVRTQVARGYKKLRMDLSGMTGNLILCYWLVRHREIHNG